MQEAENKRNKDKLGLIMCLIFIAIQLEAQYTYQPMSDSIKYDILSQSPSLFQGDVLGTKISRDNMPIFCKWELDIQDQTGIPIKFRLGSQEYVDRLEKKTRTY